MHKHMAMTVVIICVVATSGWIAAQDFPGNPDRGEAIYKANCLRCHGKLGDGNGPDARDLIVQPKDFHTLESRGRTDFELLLAISNGVLFTPMHSWRGRLKDQEMLDVIRYVRALASARVTS
jgi:mono/diheme cytochrome c family protein